MERFSPISIIDFEDSFTYNIAAVIHHMGGRAQVIPFAEASGFLEGFKPAGRHVLIYGPGPGHPEEYRELFTPIKNLLTEKKIFHLGICLGHQILWRIKGFPVGRSESPVHGQRCSFRIPHWPEYFEEKIMGKRTLVQRYNSLTVQVPGTDPAFCLSSGECSAGRFPRGLTYQFHPESIGTSFPQVFFAPIFKFLYNGANGKYFPAD